MIEIMDKLKESNDWGERVQTKTVDSAKLECVDEAFNAQIMNFGISFSDDPMNVAREIYRTLKFDGTVVITCWKNVALLRFIYGSPTLGPTC